MTWLFVLLYKLPKIRSSISLIKLMNSFLSQRKNRVLVEGEISATKDIQIGVSQGSVLSPALSGVFKELFANYTCVYATERKEGYIFRKLQ
jgi:hypothetical protein